MFTRIAVAIAFAAIVSAPAVAQKLAQSHDPGMGTGNIVAMPSPSQSSGTIADDAYRARAQALPNRAQGLIRLPLKPLSTEEKALFDRISPYGD